MGSTVSRWRWVEVSLEDFFLKLLEFTKKEKGNEYKYTAKRLWLFLWK